MLTLANYFAEVITLKSFTEYFNIVNGKVVQFEILTFVFWNISMAPNIKTRIDLMNLKALAIFQLINWPLDWLKNRNDFLQERLSFRLSTKISCLIVGVSFLLSKKYKCLSVCLQPSSYLDQNNIDVNFTGWYRIVVKNDSCQEY